MVARGSFSSDDSSSQCSVDLGLGFGLKPGGLPKSDENSRTTDLEPEFSLFHNASSPTVEEIENGAVSEDDERTNKTLTWRNSLQEGVGQLKEKTGLSRISKFGLPKRSFSLKLPRRTCSESLAEDGDRVIKRNSHGLLRVNSAKGKLEERVQMKISLHERRQYNFVYVYKRCQRRHV